jgi:uncharacterized protein (TIGR03086 family)
MTENRDNDYLPASEPPVAQLARALDAAGDLIVRVRAEDWAKPTPCTDWDVRRLVEHLIGMNRVFAALLVGAPPPRRPEVGDTEPDPVGAYRESAAALQRAFATPGVLEREYVGPLGAATGAERLQIRLYDLLAHGWDLAQATDQPADLPDDLAEQSLTFVQAQLAEPDRAGRFAPATNPRPDASAIERLVAFLGRQVPASP